MTPSQRAMKRTDTVSLSLPADAAYMTLAAFAARSCAQGMGFADDDVKKIGLAMEEAFAHALEFGYGGDTETLELTISRTPLGIRLGLVFRGLPLEIEQLPRYDPSRAEAYGDVTGLSLHLIDKMLDAASFSTEPGGFRTVSMEKHLPVEPVSGSDAPPSKGARRVNVEHRLRPARPEDAEAISRLVFQSHGSVLFCEHIYYPARVREMLLAQEMVSIVFEATETGEILGHGALVKSVPGARVEEMTFGVVDPRFRSQGGATALAKSLEENAEDRGVYAIEVFAVTNHVHSQRSVLNNGYVESGLLVETSPASSAWGKNEAGPQRIGNVVYTKYLSGLGEDVLHVPVHHRHMVSRMYAQHGMTPTFGDSPGEAALPDTETTLWSRSDFTEGWTLIKIVDYGFDALLQVSTRVELACAQGLAAIQMILPLADPATAAMTALFEGLGFFFAGVGPDPEGRENLILQYIDLPATDYDSIHVHSDLAREIKQYVMACDPRVQAEGLPTGHGS